MSPEDGQPGVVAAQHPLARDWDLRSAGADALLWVWAARLTWNYFRREEWKFGQREDWRYTKMAAEHPHHWWWMGTPLRDPTGGGRTG